MDIHMKNRKDGSVLLAKYIEHQVAVDTTDNANSTTCGTEKARAIRVLELGCGTGLAGLAAAFSLGRRQGGGGRHPATAARSTPSDRSGSFFDGSTVRSRQRAGKY